MHQQEINRLIREIRTYIENDYVLTRTDQDRIDMKMGEFASVLNGIYRERLLTEIQK